MRSVSLRLALATLSATLGMGVLLLGLTACASKTAPLQTVQVSHDSLAIAQDLEATLCWGVPAAKDAPADRTHCTSPTAGTIGLTDAVHQKVNAALAEAFSIHRAVTAQAKAGITNVDSLDSLSKLITAILADLATLQQTPAVVQLTSTVKSAQVTK